MSSLRHNGYLDAAREAILDVGWRRTTLTEVARRAGVSRMTIYRTWPDMQTLLADLMTREWEAVVAAVPDAEPDQLTAERLADGMLAAIRAMRDNHLFRRILDVDPELLLPYLLDRPGRVQQTIIAVLADRIRAGQRAGHLREGEPETLARVLVLAGHGLTLSAHTMTDDRVEQATLERSFADVLVAGLAR